MYRLIAAPLLLALLAQPGIAAAPPFTTAAPVAYMEDGSSGAVLYAKDADRRMPPASKVGSRRASANLPSASLSTG